MCNRIAFFLLFFTLVSVKKSYTQNNNRKYLANIDTLKIDSSRVFINGGIDIFKGERKEFTYSDNQTKLIIKRNISKTQLLEFDSIYSDNKNLVVTQFELDLGCLKGDLRSLLIRGNKINDRWKSIIKNRDQKYISIKKVVFENLITGELYRSHVYMSDIIIN